MSEPKIEKIQLTKTEMASINAVTWVFDLFDLSINKTYPFLDHQWWNFISTPTGELAEFKFEDKYVLIPKITWESFMVAHRFEIARGKQIDYENIAFLVKKSIDVLNNWGKLQISTEGVTLLRASQVNIYMFDQTYTIDVTNTMAFLALILQLNAQKAVDGLVHEADIIIEQVTQSQIFEGRTEEDARVAASMSEISSDRIIEVILTRPMGERYSHGFANNVEDATASAKKDILNGAFEIQSPEVIREAKNEEIEIQAYSESDVWKQWETKKPKDVVSPNLKCVIEPKNSIFGIGGRLGIWKISWNILCHVRIKYMLPAQVTIYYKE